jgi:hypothetical protein
MIHVMETEITMSLLKHLWCDDYGETAFPLELGDETFHTKVTKCILCYFLRFENIPMLIINSQHIFLCKSIYTMHKSVYSLDSIYIRLLYLDVFHKFCFINTRTYSRRRVNAAFGDNLISIPHNSTK